ncbi:FtsW/RodA/SpoVE family cell cycle protein [Limibacillus halophilus]|jgi:cell division protein FtsW
MTSFARTDTSVLGRWWWTVDRWTLLALGILIAFGMILTLAASPAAGGRIGLEGFHLAKRQLVLIPVAAAILIGVSLLSVKWVRRLAVIGFLGSLVMLLVTLAFGTEIKGAVRWISIAGFSLQPSEFVKPTFAITAAWMFAAGKEEEGFPGISISILLYLMVAALLLAQPDLGQTVVITAVWGGQFFLAGLPLLLVAGLAIAAVGGIIGAYFLLPHVAARIDGFLDPQAGDRYQVNRSLEAFSNGGLFGTGPGEGSVKNLLPDSHSDFIFAVAGEEFGALVCLFIVALFAVVVLRSMLRLWGEHSLFVLLAASGLIFQFGLQALINMGSTLHLMPTKGMTLPFISYGGSSLLALALGMGMLLALTRKRGALEEDR